MEKLFLNVILMLSEKYQDTKLWRSMIAVPQKRQSPTQ